MAGEVRTWVVDSVEDGVAAVDEDGARLAHLPAWLLPDGSREGDVLRVHREPAEDGGVVLRVTPDPAAAAEALRRSREHLARLAQGDPGGDIRL